MRKILLASFVTILSFSLAIAQGDIDQIMKGSLADANKLVEGYLNPAMKGIGFGLNQGWYNTAKPHKTLGVDLTITMNLVYFPASEKSYLVDNTKTDYLKLVSFDGKSIDPASGSAYVPTIFGADKSPIYRVKDKSTGILGPEITGPSGMDLKNALKVTSGFPVPMYNLGIGLPKNFDIKFRFSPTLTAGDLKFNLFGIGLMHDVGQYIPGVKSLPVDISLFAGYTKMGLEMSLDRPDQKGIVAFHATTIQALASKKISVVTVYGGLGYSLAKSNVDLVGNYDLDGDSANGYETKDPIALDFTSSGMRATAGFRLKLAVFTLHTDYTLSNYNSLSAGFGINVR